MVAAEDPSDEALIARIVRGDRESFAALYRRRRGDVYRFALHISGSRMVADDVTQDVFMAVIHDAARYRPDRADVVPWLLGIARNQVRRAMSQRPTVTLPDDDSETNRTPAIHADPLAALAKRQDVVALRRAVLDLPVKFREAIVLCDLQELSYADAAVSLGCAIGTVRSRLHRGRALLASRLRRVDEAQVRTPLARWML